MPDRLVSVAALGCIPTGHSGLCTVPAVCFPSRPPARVHGQGCVSGLPWLSLHAHRAPPGRYDGGKKEKGQINLL